MKTHDEKYLRQIIDSWVEDTSWEKAPLVSPFFHEKVLDKVQFLKLDPSMRYDRFFLKTAVALVFILIFANLLTIYSGRKLVVKSSSVTDQIVLEYENLENDSYSNYSVLALDHKTVNYGN